MVLNHDVIGYKTQVAELNYQANWELVIMLILNKRVK